jgi:hypothetical protein
LIYLGEDLMIFENPVLVNLAGLEKLTRIWEQLTIEYNDGLTSLAGLENLTNIVESFQIRFNPSLSNLDALSNLTSIGLDLIIGGNIVLTSLKGLNNLTSIGGYLQISGNTSLKNLTDLNNLTSIGSNLTLRANSSLASLDGLSNLTTIGGILKIEYNTILQSLSGLDNIDPGTIENLVISFNDSLSICAVKSICGYLENPIASLTTGLNSTGCNTKDEIKNACLTISVPARHYENDFTICPNPAENEFVILNKDGAIINEVIIFNQLGQKILIVKHIENIFDVSMLKQGIYFVELVSNKSGTREILIIK